MNIALFFKKMDPSVKVKPKLLCSQKSDFLKNMVKREEKKAICQCNVKKERIEKKKVRA